MPTHKDRFPVNHAALHEKAQQTVHYLMNTENRNRMGFPVRKEGRRRRVPVPDTHPVATVHLPSSGVVELRYIDRGTRSRAKPNGVHYAEIAWIVSDIPPQTWKSLTNISVSIQTPFRLSFEFDAEGKNSVLRSGGKIRAGRKGRGTRFAVL